MAHLTNKIAGSVHRFLHKPIGFDIEPWGIAFIGLLIISTIIAIPTILIWAIIHFA